MPLRRKKKRVNNSFWETVCVHQYCFGKIGYGASAWETLHSS
jgi:hypothetical protein